MTGVSLGWYLKPAHQQTLSQFSQEQQTPAHEINRVTTEATANTQVELNRTQSAEAPPYNEQDVATVSGNNSSQLTPEQIISEWNADQIFEFLRNRNGFDSGYFIPVSRRIGEDLELAGQILDRLLDLDDKDTLERVINHLQLSNHMSEFEIEKQILERIKSGDQPSEWLRVLGALGVGSADSLSYLSEQLPYYSEQSDLTAAINALAGFQHGFNDYSSIAPETRRAVVSQIEPYLYDDDPKVRAAAISSLSSHPRPDREQLLISAIQDDNDLVQREAFGAILFSSIQSPALKQALFDAVRDTERSMENRLRASSALNKYMLDGQEQEFMYAFGQEQRRYFEEQRAKKNEE